MLNSYSKIILITSKFCVIFFFHEIIISWWKAILLAFLRYIYKAGATLMFIKMYYDMKEQNQIDATYFLIMELCNHTIIYLHIQVFSRELNHEKNCHLVFLKVLVQEPFFLTIFGCSSIYRTVFEVKVTCVNYINARYKVESNFIF